MENLKNLLLSELSLTESYLNRLYHALIDMGKLAHIGELHELSLRFDFDLSTHLETRLLKKEFASQKISIVTPKEFRKRLFENFKIAYSLITLQLDEKETLDFTVDFINISYKYAFELHLLVLKKTQFEIAVSKSPLLKKYLESENPHLERMELSKEDLLSAAQGRGVIYSMVLSREEKYKSYLYKGHQAIFHKKYKEALDFFKRAESFKETAEILNLIGWSHSLLGDIQTAKAQCLKAIEKDPHYGASYNDLGSYLLNEGNFDESLKWFSLAKKALHYENREYPYINSGRAYLGKKEYELALEEFSWALTIAPQHEELHQSIEKIKKLISSSQGQLNENYQSQ